MKSCGLITAALPVLGLISLWISPAAGAASRLRKPGGQKQYPHPNPDLISAATFDQILDHNDTSKGTFSQRYWYDAQYWAGPGSPVFLFNVGEQAADNYTGYLYNSTLPGLYAQTFNGAAIVIEHRYWGESIPFSELTAETLQYLNLPQSVYDMTYFASNVSLPFDESNGGANAGSSPWVLIGGSYPGALAAWTQQIHPGVFWAYHASSAVVEATYDFFHYFDAVEAGIPRNCSNDLQTVVSYIDKTIASGDATDTQNLLNMFGLESLGHADDFAEQLAGPLWDWQEDEQAVFDFCDAVELSGSSHVVSAAHEGGVGLDAALQGYAAYISQSSPCGEESCDTYTDPAAFNEPTLLTGERQWYWMLCDNPFAWWQTGPPNATAGAIVSTYLTAEHFQRQCPLMFPPTNNFECGSERGFTTAHLNMYTGGWSAKFDHVMFVGGSLDPWLPVTVSSPQRDGGPLASTDNVPIFIIQNGNHVPDLLFDEVVEGGMDVVQQEIAVMKGWLDEWASKH